MTHRPRLGAAAIRPEPAPTVNRTLETTVNQPTETNRAADRLVADARRAVHEALVYLPAPEADRVCSLLADLETAVEGRTAMRFAAPAVVSAPVPPTGQTALRDRIAEALLEYLSRTADIRPGQDGQLAFMPEITDAERTRIAEHLAAVLPAPADRAAVLLAAAEELDRYVGLQSSDAAPEVEGARLVIRELRRIAGQPDPVSADKCGCFSPSGAYRCTQPAGHLGYHRHTRPDTDEWSSWVTGTTEADLGRMAAEARGAHPVEAPSETCAHCGKSIQRITGTLTAWWVHDPGGHTTCSPRRAASSPRATPKVAAEARQDEPWPVQESTRRYAEELRRAHGQASADGHTGWECDAGASLLVGASTPGPGKLGTHHGTVYACATHQSAAVERITGAGYEADPQPAPPGHRWNPWPCGHVTAHDTQALTTLTATGAQS